MNTFASKCIPLFTPNIAREIFSYIIHWKVFATLENSKKLFAKLLQQIQDEQKSFSPLLFIILHSSTSSSALDILEKACRFSSDSMCSLNFLFESETRSTLSRECLPNRFHALSSASIKHHHSHNKEENQASSIKIFP